MDRFLKIINKESNGISQAAILLGAFSLLSQLLGLVRDRILAHQIGPSRTLDIYYAAFQIPDLIYLSVASLASVTVLMQFLVEKLDHEGKESAKKFLSDVLNGFLLLLGAVSILAFVFMPKLAHLVAPGFDSIDTEKLISVSRIMLLSPIFMGLSNLLGTVTQLLKRFFVFSLSPVFYNIGIILGIIFFYPRFGAIGLAYGVALGSVFHFLIQIPTVLSSDFRPKLFAKINFRSLKTVTWISLPRTLGLAMNNIALLVIIAIGSTMGAGSISIFKFASNLESVPVGIIGLSFAVAIFPFLTEAHAKGEQKNWQESILSATRQIIFWSLPISALFIVLRAQIVRVILGSGMFSWNDTRLVAAAFAILAIGLVGQNLILISVRAFYSMRDTKTPLIVNTLSSVLIIVGAFGLVRFFNYSTSFRYFFESLFRVDGIPGTAVLMLPLAYTLGTFINAIVHFWDLKRNHMSSLGTLPRTIWQSLFASLGIGGASYVMLNILAPIFNLDTFYGVFMQGFLSGMIGIFFGIAILYALGNEQFFEMTSALRKKFWKTDLETMENKDL